MGTKVRLFHTSRAYSYKQRGNALGIDGFKK
jgi:hypothetical protein